MPCLFAIKCDIPFAIPFAMPSNLPCLLAMPICHVYLPSHLPCMFATPFAMPFAMSMLPSHWPHLFAMPICYAFCHVDLLSPSHNASLLNRWPCLECICLSLFAVSLSLSLIIMICFGSLCVCVVAMSSLSLCQKEASSYHVTWRCALGLFDGQPKNSTTIHDSLNSSFGQHKSS